MTTRKGTLLVGASLLVVLGLVTLGLITADRDRDRDRIISNDGTAKGTDTDVTREQLTRVATSKVFFGHQSVGGNVLGGIPTVFDQNGVAAPEIVESTEPLYRSGGYLQHAKIGENGDPQGKIQDFARILRGSVADEIDVAMMKFCYIDITPETDVDALFAEYKQTVSALQDEYPVVTFIHVTTPLTTEPSLKSRLMGIVGRGPADAYTAEQNVAREKLNSLIRAEYGDSRYLFDLAATESTTPEGDRVGGSQGGEPYYALYSGYASDPGHLNDAGAAVGATQLLRTIATARGVGQE